MHLRHGIAADRKIDRWIALLLNFDNIQRESEKWSEADRLAIFTYLQSSSHDNIDPGCRNLILRGLFGGLVHDSAPDLIQCLEVHQNNVAFLRACSQIKALESYRTAIQLSLAKAQRNQIIKS
ncbi:hypothetical protein MYX84_01285 [Acidobacteria bacterium AH-259-O06]|nr:hypothetical protein [Acidobacteria bacterium AH-259-O06]